MSVKNVETYVCDYCGTQSTYLSRLWFLVNGNSHDCGHGIMDLLSKMRIPVKKSCNMYADKDVTGTGFIDFESKKLVEIGEVIVLATAKFRRSG